MNGYSAKSCVHASLCISGRSVVKLKLKAVLQAQAIFSLHPGYILQKLRKHSESGHQDQPDRGKLEQPMGHLWYTDGVEQHGGPLPQCSGAPQQVQSNFHPCMTPFLLAF